MSDTKPSKKYVDLNKSQVFSSRPDWRDEYAQEVFGGRGTVGGDERSESEHGDPSEKRDDVQGLPRVQSEVSEAVEKVEDLIERLRTLRGKLLWAETEEKESLWNRYGGTIEGAAGSLSSVQDK